MKGVCFVFRCLNILLKSPSAFSRQSLSLSSPRHKEAKLEVVKVGSYSCSVAENLADIRRVDESVFKLTPNFDKLLAKYYAERFGFVICQLQTDGKQHPIGYVHDMVTPGELFVPTRHQHGNGGEETDAHWDHKIYSLNTDSKGAGRTPEEEFAYLKMMQYAFAYEEPTLKVDEKFLERMVIPLAPMQCIRRLTYEGTYTNRDVVLEVAAPVSG